MKDKNGVPLCVYDQQFVLISSHSKEHHHTTHFKRTPLVEHSSCLGMGTNGTTIVQYSIWRQNILLIFGGELAKIGC